MSSFVTDWSLAGGPDDVGPDPDRPLVVVVGYDGSVPAKRALARATALLHGREGSLEVVFVAPLPARAAVSGEAFVAVRQGFADAAESLAVEVRETLRGGEPRWHFQGREGSVANELLTVAEEVRQEHGGDAAVVIIVGGSERWYHHFAGAVGARLARHDRFPLVVVP